MWLFGINGSWEGLKWKVFKVKALTWPRFFLSVFCYIKWIFRFFLSATTKTFLGVFFFLMWEILSFFSFILFLFCFFVLFPYFYFSSFYSNLAINSFILPHILLIFEEFFFFFCLLSSFLFFPDVIFHSFFVFLLLLFVAINFCLIAIYPKPYFAIHSLKLAR